MKNTYHSTIVDQPTRVTWTAVENGLWVAKSDGEFAGLAEKHWGSGFSVTDQVGRAVGEFPTLGEAKESLLHQSGLSELERDHPRSHPS